MLYILYILYVFIHIYFIYIIYIYNSVGRDGSVDENYTQKWTVEFYKHKLSTRIFIQGFVESTSHAF